MKAMSLISDPFWSISIKNIMNIKNILSWYRFQCHLTIIPSITKEINNYQTIFSDIQINKEVSLQFKVLVQLTCGCSVICKSLRPHGLYVVYQVPLSMEFSRQGGCNGLPFSTPGDPPGPGIKSTPLASPELAGGFFTTGASWKVLFPKLTKRTKSSKNVNRKSSFLCLLQP